ncbi:hypothetical protein H2203_006896 [Taxawa tesnikishii (nom. ined.)]|nr:hypothetical protein H2203_006896 [Dothideales sp. JES 119]
MEVCVEGANRAAPSSSIGDIAHFEFTKSGVLPSPSRCRDTDPGPEWWSPKYRCIFSPRSLREFCKAQSTARSTSYGHDKENSQDPEDEDAVVAPPMASLFEVTRLRNIRSKLNEPARSDRSEISDLISEGKVNMAEADELFRTFSCSLNHYLWGGIALLHSELSSARKSSALLTTAILAVTALHLPGKEALFDVCYTEFLALICDSMFARYHSLDDIRGLCIGAFWLSEVSWKLSGHAVRIAMEMNLHLSFPKAMRTPSLENLEHARLWYFLYVCDHHFSIAYGRPPMIHEDATITCHESFLQLPGITQPDHRLHSQVGVFIILSRIQNTFGLDDEEQFDEGKVLRMRQFNLDLDGWRTTWESRLAPNPYVATYPAKGVVLHYHFAKLQLNALAYRGLSEQTASVMSTAQREFASFAVLSAENLLNVVLSEPDIRSCLVGVPLYLHTIITFSVVFLLKIHLKWSRLTPCSGQRHLSNYIAKGLQGMLNRLRKWDEDGQGRSDTMPQSARGIWPNYRAPLTATAPAQEVDYAEMAEFYGLEDQYFPVDFFNTLTAQIPG